CDKADRVDVIRQASSPTAPAEERGPAPQPRPKEPTAARAGRVTLLPVPNGGIQPQAIADARGTLHLLYFKGDNAGAGDLFYVRRQAGKDSFSEPIRINSRPASACAVGSVRGGQIALGKEGRVHV